MRLRLLLISFVLVVAMPLFSQSAKPLAGKEPAWIVKNDVDYAQTSLDKDATEGSLDICYEAQISLDNQSKFVRRSKKILSQAGVQNESTISVSFDPSYEQLTFHKIQILRQGEILNRLDLSKIKTIHQEEELSNFIYNGTLDAVLILEDVRKGDIIEYSYSIKGHNPVFNNKYAGEFTTQYSVPVYNLFYRLLVPKGRTIHIKNVNDTIQPVIKEVNGQQSYEWRKSNIPPFVVQDNTPSWYNPYATVYLSEYSSWKEVNDWSMELFAARPKLSPEVQKKIAEIMHAYPDDAGRTTAALRFVQDDIRYMGIEMGRHSHKPADPSKIFAQRFGDCKEKSYLLCCMLNAMNIEASPVLINTEMKKSLYDVLPAPTAFNHVTVRVKLDSVYYWFDPTIAFQRGNIKDLFYPDYQAGLVIGSNTNSLATIPFRNISYQHIDEYFKTADRYDGGKLVVTTRFKGGEADDTRALYNNQSNAEILAGNKKFYAKYYEDIQADSLTYYDNDSTGIFTSIEYYHIPHFWNTEKGSLKKFYFSAFAIDNILHRPKDKQRKMPFGLTYPVRYREEITISLPEPWDVTPAESHLTNKGFDFNSKFYCEYNQVHLVADYENHKDFVASDELPAYSRNINEYDDNEYYTLSSGDTAGPGRSTAGSAKDIINVVLLVVIIAGGLLWWASRR